MPDSRTELPWTAKRIVVAADYGGFEAKEYLAGKLRETHYEMVDYGGSQPNADDAYPEFVAPLADAVARGEVDRGIAIRSSVGACIAANKVPDGRACPIHEGYLAHQGAEDDDMSVICLRGRAVANTSDWESVGVSLEAQFSGAGRRWRRVAKIAELEARESGS